MALTNFIFFTRRFDIQDANQVQAALISLHNMTHFLGSQPMTHYNKETTLFMQGADEELRADSGSNLGLDTLGNDLFERKLIQAVILMDVLDRTFKYILSLPMHHWMHTLVSHHDAAAGQMRLNALRHHGALKQISTKQDIFVTLIIEYYAMVSKNCTRLYNPFWVNRLQHIEA